MASKSNEMVVQSMYEAFSKKDFDKLDSLGSSQSEWVEVAFESSQKGPLAIRQSWEEWSKVFPDGQIEIQSLISDEDHVIVRGIGRGTHQGVFSTPIGELQPTGQRVEIPFCDVIELSDGKIIKAHSYFDFQTFLRQLGFESKVTQAA